MNHYPHHIGDFAKKTKGLSLAERGAYRELLDQYYTHEKALPLDRREVYRMAVAATPAERKAVDYVLAKYFVEQQDGYHQNRADDEIALFRKRSKTGSENAESRWRKDAKNDKSASDPQCETDANLVPNGCQVDAIPMLAVKDLVSTTKPYRDPLNGARDPVDKPKGGHKNGLVNQTVASITGWMTNEAACLEKAKSVGITPNRGEGWPELRNRIVQAEAAQRR